jgi:hypothetical protein
MQLADLLYLAITGGFFLASWLAARGLGRLGEHR